MGFIGAQCSYRGSREYNEDTTLLKLDAKLTLAVVADGLGGHGGGDIASRTAADEICGRFVENPVIDEPNLRRIFECANAAVLARQQSGVKMKTTAVALFHDGTALAVAHMGDSRLYHFRNGSLEYRTLDHSVSQLAVQAGDIADRDIRHHEDRSRVLRVLGSDGDINPEIFIARHSPSGADAFLLCSDGFWENVWEGEMAADLTKSSTPQQWLDYMIARVGRRLTVRSDNFSAVALFGAD